MGGMTRLLLLLWAGVTLTTTLDLQKRIYGGTECPKKDRHYHVKLLDGNNNFICGGSLIAKKWILTAAHCKKPSMKAVVRVHQGPKKPVKIKNPPVIYRDHDGLEHDIMLLKLSMPTLTTKTIALPTCGIYNKPQPNKDEVQVAGHGHTTKQEGAQESDTLLCATLKIQDTKKEWKALETGDNPFFQKKKHQHLFFGKSSQQDTCPGDSGGGVVFKGMIYGVHSFAGKTECRTSAKFMDVCAYLEWIKDTIKK